MDNGGFFLLGLFGFFFLMWILGGGPQNPISSEGLFITAATTTADKQTAYGPTPNIDASVSLPGNGSISAHSDVTDTGTKPTTTASPSVPSVSMARSTQTSSANPSQKYLEFLITSHSTSEINLNGWKFVSKNLGSAAQINSNTEIEAEKTILVVTSFPTTSSHDTMELVDTDGSVVATASY